ncbi:T-box transcription factor TBX15-like [Schistocerca gregaria]|uniref:T-box transcription factor TBX15-like n=1 Tax=Schistocerca gregaria TaxID=7010 RepID=UPI00211EDA97|nr:T-box transcription factor TBX15-like [Schistocerca gregaria]
MTLKRDASELSSRARAFSVEALIGDKRTADEGESADVGQAPQPQHQPQPQPQPLPQPQQPAVAGPQAQTPQQGTRQQRRSELRVELCSRDLWRRFHALGTEMIITKAGRRMFPTVKVRLGGLDPAATYIVFLDIVPLDDKRYRYVYHSSQWMVAGSGDPPLAHSVYVHPDSPATGQLWMAQGVVAFDKLKLTNNRRPLVRGQVSLHSMHKYLPRVHILETTDLETPAEQQASVERALTYTFPETAFTTVTAYQNQQITRLKIASNPFAKGFREASRTRDGSEDTRQLCRPLSGPGAVLPTLRPEMFSFAHTTTNPAMFSVDPYCNAAVTPLLHRGFYPLTAPVRFVVPPQLGLAVTGSTPHALCVTPDTDSSARMYGMTGEEADQISRQKEYKEEVVLMDTNKKTSIDSTHQVTHARDSASFLRTVPLDLSKLKHQF